MTTPPSSGRTPDTPDRHSSEYSELQLMKWPLLSVVAVGVVCTVVTTVMFGTAGLLAGVLGTVIVLGFFGIGQYIVFRVLRNNPAIAMNVALLTYLLQMVVLFILLLILRDATFFAPKAFAFTVLAGALVWTFAAVTVMVRSKVIYVDPGNGPYGPIGK